jgi:chromosome segregation ATPase
MTDQEQIDKLTNAIAALDNQISQVQAALNSPSTTGDQVLALRSALIQLQAQRSALMSALIDLQASTTEVDALDAPAAAPEVQAVHNELKASITNSAIVDTTLHQAAAVKGNVALLQSMITKPNAKSAGGKKH